MSGPTLRPAREEDVPQIEALLLAEHLPPQGIKDWLPHFFVLEDGGRVVGCAGLEVYGRAALLRSVAVTPELRGGRQGERLVQAALARTRELGVRSVYLFTMAAGDFFSRFGFRDTTVEEFDPAVRGSFQVQAVSTIPQLRERVRAMRLDYGG